MADATQMFTVGIPTFAVLIGVLVDNSRLGDLSNWIADLRQDVNRRFDEVDRRIEDTRDLFRAESLRAEQVLDVKHLEENR
jgi:hypothetical protein